MRSKNEMHSIGILKVTALDVRFCSTIMNEMVSTGDTEISLHIRSPRFRAYGGGYSGVRTENTQFSGGDYSGVRTNKHR